MKQEYFDVDNWCPEIGEIKPSQNKEIKRKTELQRYYANRDEINRKRREKYSLKTQQ